MEKGLALQKEIFGDEIERMYETSPANQLHIQRALSGNCFGDYQTRTGLDVRTRELLTFRCSCRWAVASRRSRDIFEVM